MRNTFLVLLAAATVASCASNPSVLVTYYLPKAETQLTATQTLGCNAGGTLLVVATTVSPTTTYAADRSATGSFSFRKLRGLFSDADATVNFTTDGRIASINGSSTGQGETILKDAMTLTATAVSSGLLFGQEVVNNPVKSACDAIAAHTIAKPSTDNKPASSAPTVTLTYGARFFYVVSRCPQIVPPDVATLGDDTHECLSLINDPTVSSSSTVVFVADSNSDALFGTLSQEAALKNLGPSVALASAAPLKRAAVLEQGQSASGTKLSVNDVTEVTLTVTGLTGQVNDSGAMLKRLPLWSDSVRVPMTDSLHIYQIPLPAPAVFGKTQFSIQLNPDGSISKLEYGETNGAGDALTALNSLAQAASGPTNAQRASALQSQADVIYEQQRLVLCKTNPTTCPSK